MDNVLSYANTNNIYDDVCRIIEDSQKVAFQAVNRTLVLRNWLLGKCISEEELDGAGRAEYGSKVISTLADCLTERYGKGFTKRSLYKYQQFYKCFPEIMPSVGGTIRRYPKCALGECTIAFMDTLQSFADCR